MSVRGDIFNTAGTNGTVTKAEITLPKRDPKDERIEELEGDLRKLQKCVTCVICQDMLFEPYSLKCGHVFCYTCMLDWLGLHKKRTCPECRAVVKGQPAPAYVIRDMIETFVARAELTSPHGTGAELRKQQKEALVTVNRDRATEGIPKGGLFRGMFKARQKPLRGILDPGDGILRCPSCIWEIAGGHCARCRRRVRSPSHHEDDFSDEDDDEDDDDSGSETESQEGAWDVDGELGEEELDEEEEDWEDNATAQRSQRLDRQRSHEYTDEDEEDGEDEDGDGMGDMAGGRDEPITLDDDSDLSLEVTYSSRNRVGGAARARRRPAPVVMSQAREQRGGRRSQEDIDEEEEEEEEEDSEDEDEGSLEEFVVHDTPENRRRRPAGNSRNARSRNGGVAIGNNRSFQNARPLVISSSPAIPAPTRRNPRNTRRTITDTDEEGSSIISEASSRPPPFLGEIRHDYNHRRGPIALPSDDDGEEELLGPGMGYTPLEHTASENEDDDGYSSPPRRGRQRGQSGRIGPGSVFSVPEEDEEDEESRGFGDDDESDDQDGDVRMGGQPQRRVRTRTSRPQIIDDDSDSDSDVAPAPRRRRNLTGNHFRTHHHNSNTSTRRQREIVPNILDAFQQHRQAMSERQLDNLFRNSARSATPVQRHYTGGSNRGSRSTRESTADSSWEVTPMGQSSPPPPFSPMFQGVSSSPAPVQPRSPGKYPQSPASPRLSAPARAGSENNNVWSPVVSPQPQQQQQQPRPPQQQQRQVPITIGSSPQTVRVRPRNSRQQLRGSSSRAGLRVGSITPTPANPSTGGTTSRQSFAGPSAPSLATRNRRGVALTTEDIRARGEAVRRRQQEAAEAANGGLRRRSSRRDLEAGNSNSAPPLGMVGRTGSGLSGQGRRLGAVIGGPPGGGGGGPMLVFGNEDD